MSGTDGKPSTWRAINPPEMAKAVGYSNAVESRGGRRLTIAGQVDMAPDGKVAHPGDLVAQVRGAFANVARVLAAAGARPDHLVRMRIFVTDIPAYQANAKAIGGIYREHFGRWYPAMTLVQISRLFDEGAVIEVEGEAVVPDPA
ncbi:MAG: RidA family protein [Planctomycetota bacterium]|jgi:enamine deaminase RidA (YjgF/YER057c/UK114 family)